MRWKVATSTVTGKAHTDRGEAGQDYHKAGTFRLADAEFFIGIAADGAGSTTDGGKGAEIACETAYTHILATLREAGGIAKITDEDIRTWITAAHDAVAAAAQERGKRERDFACTFVCSVSGEDGALFFQIGDGAIVTGSGDDFQIIFWPEQGEYANTTFFVTDDQYLDHLHVQKIPAPPVEIALFTDGLQNLVLSFAQKKAHPGFFRPLFDALDRFPESSFASFSTQLQGFLCRDEINARSDDDKTLILAKRVAG
jgi:hypothetical protein